MAAVVYVPRSPKTGVLYGVVCTHLSDFLAAVDEETDGSGVPGFVVNEFPRLGAEATEFRRDYAGECRTPPSQAPTRGALVRLGPS